MRRKVPWIWVNAYFIRVIPIPIRNRLLYLAYPPKQTMAVFSKGTPSTDVDPSLSNQRQGIQGRCRDACGEPPKTQQTHEQDARCVRACMSASVRVGAWGIHVGSPLKFRAGFHFWITPIPQSDFGSVPQKEEPLVLSLP